MRVLVTGSAGFIGSALCAKLLTTDADVVGVDCFLPDSYDPSIKRRRQEELSRISHGAMKFIELDLRKDPLDAALDGVDVICNLAAMPGLIKSWSDFNLYVQCNLLGVDRLLNSPKYAAKKFIQASTSSVYGKHAISDEKGECNPFSPYGVSKLAAENLIRAHSANFGTNYLVLRYFSVYGPNQRPDMAYSIFCQKLLEDEEIQVFGDGSATRSNTYIDDLVLATINAIYGQVMDMTVNICSSQEISVNEAIDVLSNELEVKPRVRYLAARPGDQQATKGVNNLAAEMLGLRDSVSIAEGLRNQAREAKRKFNIAKENGR